MSETQPGGSDAEIAALLRALGTDEANLDDGVRNVREIVRAKTAAARVSEGDIYDWFTSHSSVAIARVIRNGQLVIDERMADGVFD